VDVRPPGFSGTTAGLRRRRRGGTIAVPIERIPVFAIAVRFDLTDEAAAGRFDDLVAATVPGILAEEEGTLVYTPHRVDGEPLARLFYEVYRDRAAHAAHEARPATAAFLEQVNGLVSAVRAEFLVPADEG
jgi:quinol monooxygenase YgiN